MIWPMIDAGCIGQEFDSLRNVLSGPVKTKRYTLPNAVLKSVVCRSWVHHVTSSKLLDVPQSLELRGVNYLDAQWMKLDVPMDWVVDDLKQKMKFWWRKYI